jgi:hypothetical protein
VIKATFTCDWCKAEITKSVEAVGMRREALPESPLAYALWTGQSSPPKDGPQVPESICEDCSKAVNVAVQAVREARRSRSSR